MSEEHKTKQNTEQKDAPKTRARKGFIDEMRQKLEKKTKQSKKWALALKIVWVFLMLVWVAVVLYACQYLVAIIMVHVLKLDQGILESATTQTIYSAVIYVLCLIITIFVPWKIAHDKTTRDELGLRGAPTWTDILLAPIGFIVFMFAAVALVAVMQALLPGIDWSQEQNVGFNSILSNSDFVLAFISLVVVAPIAEEIIFRGWLYGKLRAKIPAIPAMILVSILFGIVHGQWNVGVTVFVMSLAMCTIREITGTIWGGILIHMIKNGLAFYLLYVNPAMIQ
ncbi:MAG: type II CAAX endopeptidase family protein [Candidatus Saccharibacteria bacterium]|jgi:membrane protease YdiL (CAAX protease family)|nr:type II CAAX endopeptidase family protein [Candidatus Saccharibacteria bacterium]